MKLESALIEKGSDEHERLFRAFRNGTPVRWRTQDVFGNLYDTGALVWSAEHVGKKTRFGFKKS